ncbi:MAG: exodeoxyribonuclease VII small subunit [Betaproteobacteria bacterium]|jgi:exodeoxyribonuclease VII small subunit|nr:exodeoxyribonuclease VII small subunit [Rhodocyclaceae bacterium]MCA3132962.1 exodeoxyribonuclease VII small subunit [Rhodocyclaceae bacterium]MCA3141959.1 exodeoxyribonuclease VII small subunit [Rhodocyclaceae bacterium]MCA3144867.1 exodeoxyribonuclease VII small subunit [Rhodocyclaceae bacterium]MCE2898731.1 exodeoxyribonuclease VII small subunit [Betaproteobacteria bacterium]
MAEAAEPFSPLSFEAALAELENLVASLETGQLPLEASITAYRRGADLLRHCQGVLSDAEQQVKVLEDGVLRDLDPDGGS